MIYSYNLKKIRQKRNITQEKLANKLNIKRGVYSSYETEYHIIPVKHLDALCESLDVSIDYLFGFTNIENYPNIRKIDRYLSGERLRLLRKDNNLTMKRLADLLNTSHSVIAGYEAGTYIIATPFLYTICKKFNVSADYLMGRID